VLEWKTPDFRNTPSTTNLKGEEVEDAPGKDGNASMPEQVKRPNPWREMMIIMIGYSLELKFKELKSKLYLQKLYLLHITRESYNEM
jgi:hypothetical protein